MGESRSKSAEPDPGRKQSAQAATAQVRYHSLDCSVCELHLRCGYELRMLKRTDRYCNLFVYSMAALENIVIQALTKRFGSPCSGNYGHYSACRFKDCPPNFLETCQRVEDSLGPRCRGCPRVNCANCPKESSS